MNRQDRIDAYIRNEMNKAEREAFEEDLKKDKSLADDFMMMKFMTSALEKRRKRSKRMVAWKQELAWYRDWRYLSSGVFVLNPMYKTKSDMDVSQSPNDMVSMDFSINADSLSLRLSEVDSLEIVYRYRLSRFYTKDGMTIQENKDKRLLEHKLYEIRWEKINLLLILGRKEEALNILSEFMKEGGTYQQAAKDLWDELQNY
jgi:hypothetical protein